MNNSIQTQTGRIASNPVIPNLLVLGNRTSSQATTTSRLSIPNDLPKLTSSEASRGYITTKRFDDVMTQMQTTMGRMLNVIMARMEEISNQLSALLGGIPQPNVDPTTLPEDPSLLPSNPDLINFPINQWPNTGVDPQTPVTAAPQNPILDLVSNTKRAWDNIKQIFSQASGIKDVGSEIFGYLRQGFNTVKGWAGSAFDIAKNVAAPIGNILTDFLPGAARGVAGIFKKGADYISKLF